MNCSPLDNLWNISPEVQGFKAEEQRLSPKEVYKVFKMCKQMFMTQ